MIGFDILGYYLSAGQMILTCCTLFEGGRGDDLRLGMLSLVVLY